MKHFVDALKCRCKGTCDCHRVGKGVPCPADCPSTALRKSAARPITDLSQIPSVWKLEVTCHRCKCVGVPAPKGAAA